MDKWFEDKFEKRRLRSYTKSRLQPGKFEKIYRRFSVTNWLIIFNVFVFILIKILTPFLGEEKIFYIFSLTPNEFFSGAYWTVITSVFSHYWLPHLLFNMISLFFIGNFVEKLIGRKRFFWVYIISGVFASFFHAVLSFYFGNSFIGSRIFIDPSIPALGASGAIFAIAGILAVLTPKLKVYLIAGPIVALIVQSLLFNLGLPDSLMQLLSLLIYMYILLSIFSIFSFNPSMRKIGLPLGMPFWVLPVVAIVPLVVIGLFVTLPIGNMAHLGGLLVGLGYGFYLRKKYKRKTDMIQRYFSG